MTDINRYLEHRTLVCPFCWNMAKTLVMTYGPIQDDEGDIVQGVECSDCGKEFDEVYRLVEIN